MTTCAEPKTATVGADDHLGPQLLFPPLEEPRPSRVGAYIAFAAICVIWGTTFVGIRVAIETIPTLFVSSLRFLAAGLLLLVIAIATRARFPVSTAEWRDQALAGILMGGTANTLVVYAEHEISSGLAALLAATIPIWMAVMEAFLGRARLTRRKIAGLALGFGGVGLLVAPAIGSLELSIPFLLAVGAMQGSAICWNSGTLLSRRLRTTADPMAIAVIQMLAGGIFAGIVAVLTGARPALSMFTTRSTIAMLYLAVFGSVVAYTCYLYALTKLSAGKVSSYAYVNPAVAVLFGALLLAEPVTLRMIVAMLVILGGVAVIQLEKRAPLRALESK